MMEFAVCVQNIVAVLFNNLISLITANLYNYVFDFSVGVLSVKVIN